MYSPSFYPAYGGTEIATYNLISELKTLCDIELYTFNWNPTMDKNEGYGINLSCGLPREEFVRGVYIHRYPVINLPIIRDFSIRLIKDISSSDVDILHFQGLSRLFSRWLLQKSVGNKTKVITTHALQEAVQIVERSGCRVLVSNCFVESLSNMDHIIALSNTDLVSLLHLRMPRNKITVIPNGIDPNRFSKRRQFVESNDTLKILCIARFAQNKNYESLVYALSELKNDMDFEAYFVGAIADHEYFANILKMIKGKGLEKIIKVCVSLDDPAVIDCYLSCDVFVLPSFMETFPLVILEAMYAGLPVVATNVGGMHDIIKDGVNGYLLNPNDSQQLYRRCFRLLKDERERSEMGALNKEIAKNYTWDKIALSTYNLYQRLVEEKSR